MEPRLRLHAHAARREIASGALRGSALLGVLSSIPPGDREAWTDELLGVDPPPPDVPDLPRGSVPYLPCGVDEILTLLRDVPIGPEDEWVDLGAGLGRVAILVHLLTGAHARGIEIQELLVRRAQATCEELGLPRVSFVHADVAQTELDGSKFFLYAPFNGPMLTAVLRRLEDVARRRSIVVSTVGLELGGLDWLRPRASSSLSVASYDSQPA